MKKKFLRKLTAVFLVIVSLFSMIPTITVNAAGQTSITLKQGTAYAYTSGWSRDIVPMTADGKQVYCVQPDLPAPPNGKYRTDNGKLKEITSSNSNYMMYKKALYYCYGGDGFNTSNTAFKTDTTKHQAKYSGNTPSAFMGNLKWTTGGLYYTSLTGSNLHYMYTHLLLSYIYYGDSKYKSTMGTYIPYNGYYDQIKELYNAVKSAPEPSSSLKLYFLDIGSKYQKVIVVRNAVKLQLQKSSANSSVNYNSLEGAKYNIYLDKACTDYFGYITTDSKGYGHYGNGDKENGIYQGIDVPLQNYYCKEVLAPTGFEIDSTVYQFKKSGTNSSGATIYKATVTDTPYIKLQLQKSSANTEITDDNDCYSLEGAKYNIYTDEACTDYFGYITTDANGYGRYGNGTDTNTDVTDKDTVAYKKNSGKSITLNSGITYYCKEDPEGAPKGYDVDDTVYQFKDSGSYSSDGIKIFRAYNDDNEEPSDEPINDPVGIVLQKRNAVTGETENQGLEGAIFQLQYYATEIDKDYDVASGETAPTLDSETLKRTWYIKTDIDGFAILLPTSLVDNDVYDSDEFYYSNGIVTFPIGTVVIKEIEAPSGYLKSNTVFYRRITEEGAKISQDTNTPIEVPIDEQPQSAYIGIHKMNNTRHGVQGATYGLYSDATATTLVSTLVTDSNGKGVFGYDVGVNKTYYIKEITAPAGYPLDTTVYPITPTEDNTTAETAVIQTIYEESTKGNIFIKKSSNDGVISNLAFAVVDNLGNEYNAVLTDESGEATVTGLPVYDADGKAIKYTVKELGFKTTPGTKSYGGYTWTVKAEDCIYYKGAYYEGVANNTFSDCDYTYSKYYYGNQSQAIQNANGYTKTLIENDTITYSFENTVQTTDIEVNKNSYDGAKEGFWFTVKDQFGRHYGDIKTDENGYASFNEQSSTVLMSCIKVPNSAICIPLKYSIEELGFKTPSGDGTYYFPATYKDKYVSDLASADLTKSKDCIVFDAYNYTDTGEINIIKTSDDNDIAGVCFKISAYEDLTEYGDDIYDTNVGFDSDGNALTSLIIKTNSDGKASSNSFELYDANGNKMDGLPVFVFGSTDFPITYEITELGFDNGDGTYSLPDRYIQPDSVKFDLTENRSYTYKCHNSVIDPGKLQVIKTSEDGITEGIWFNVTSTEGLNINIVTDENGQTTVLENLPVYVPSTHGSNEFVKYTITELGIENDDGTYSIPYRYKTPKSQTVTLDTTGIVKSISFTNTLKTGSVILYKQNYKGNALAGSEWELYKSDGTAVNLTQTGSGSYFSSSTGSVTTLSTNSSGKLYVYSLEQGDYYFLEVKSPSGTSTYGEKVNFTILGDDSKTLNPEITVKDNKIVLFNTGGNSNNTLYYIGFTMLAVSLAVIATYFIKTKKHGKISKYRA